MKKLTAISLLILSLGCSKQERTLSTDVAPLQAQKSVARAGSEPQAAASAEAEHPVAAPATAAQAQPMIVRTANLRIVVADTSEAVAAVTRSVEAAGGFVSGSNIWREGELLRASLTLKVPSAKLTSSLASIRGVAKRVETETITSEDVSQEVVDLESRVRNLEATENELRELLVVARQNSKKATDVLEVHEQLTVIRGQIEQAKGRMRYLSQVTAMSSITLDVIPDAIAQPVVTPGWQPLVVVREASRALVSMLQTMGTAAIWIIVYVVPVAGIVLLILFGLWRLVRRPKRSEA